MYFFHVSPSVQYTISHSHKIITINNFSVSFILLILFLCSTLHVTTTTIQNADTFVFLKAGCYENISFRIRPSRKREHLKISIYYFFTFLNNILIVSVFLHSITFCYMHAYMIRTQSKTTSLFYYY